MNYLFLCFLSFFGNIMFSWWRRGLGEGCCFWGDCLRFWLSIQSTMIGTTCNLATYTCLTFIIFGTLQDGSLQISNLVLNNCFSYRSVFENDINSLSKTVFKKLFLSKSSKFLVVWTIRLCSNFTSMWHKHFTRNVWRDFRTPIAALAKVARKSFNCILTAKIDIFWSIGHFMLPFLMLTFEVYSLSIHYLVSIWSIWWWNLSKIVWSEL